MSLHSTLAGQSQFSIPPSMRTVTRRPFGRPVTSGRRAMAPPIVVSSQCFMRRFIRHAPERFANAPMAATARPGTPGARDAERLPGRRLPGGFPPQSPGRVPAASRAVSRRAHPAAFRLSLPSAFSFRLLGAGGPCFRFPFPSAKAVPWPYPPMEPIGLFHNFLDAAGSPSKNRPGTFFSLDPGENMITVIITECEQFLITFRKEERECKPLRI